MPRGLNDYDAAELQGRNVANSNSVNIVSPGLITNGLALQLDAGNFVSYPASGTTWFDLSGNRNNGTLTNGPTFDLGGVGSINFDGSNDYVALPANSINPNADLTVSFWFAASSTAAWSTQALLSNYLSNGHLEVRLITSTGEINLVKSYITNIGTFTGTTFIMNRVTFSNAVVTLEKSTNTWTLYKNGISGGTIVSNQTFNTNVPALGTNSDGTSPVEVLDGKIALFHYYNRVLGPEEVRQNFNATRARFNV